MKSRYGRCLVLPDTVHISSSSHMACHHLWDTEQDIDDFSSGRSYSIMKSRYGRCLVASHLWLLGCNHQLTFIHIYRELWCFCLQSRTRLKIWFESKMKKYSIFRRKDLKIPVRSQKLGIVYAWKGNIKTLTFGRICSVAFLISWGCCKLFQSEEIWPSFNLHFQVQNMWSSGGGENIVHLISLDEAYLVQIGHGVAHHLL